MTEIKNASIFRLGACSGFLTVFLFLVGFVSAAAETLPESIAIENTAAATKKLSEQDSDEERQARQSDEESDGSNESDEEEEGDEEEEEGDEEEDEGDEEEDEGDEEEEVGDEEEDEGDEEEDEGDEEEDEGDEEEGEEDEGDEDEEYDEDEGDEEEGEEYDETVSYPLFEGTIIGEVERDSVLSADDNDERGNFNFISISSFLNLSLTPNLDIEADLILESSTGDERYALLYERPFVSLLAASYSGEIGGIQLGKFDPLEDIWDRGLEFFSNYPTVDLFLAEVIGLRTWWNLGTFLESEHYLSGSVFFRDTSHLSGNLKSGEDRLLIEDGGLANTEQLNNFTISLHGDELPFTWNWEYAIGFAKQMAGVDDDKNESSIFSGFYGDFDLSDDASSYPYVEILLRSGADGDDRDVTTVLLGSSFDIGAWSFGFSYSFRDNEFFVDEEENEDALDIFSRDNNAQLFASYTFSFGLYIDGGYQYLREEGEDIHTVGVAIGYPFEFTVSPAVARAEEPAKRDDRIRRKTRR